MNPISKKIKVGTVGELLVQLRLLQYDVQAAPPLKDSGNDLIAVRGDSLRAVQVKTTTGDHFSKGNLPEKYHILALAHLLGEDENIYLDQSDVFLIRKEEVKDIGTSIADLEEYKISNARVQNLF